MSVKKVTRYVITHVSDKHNLRQLTFAAQGRNTYATQEEAQETLDLFNTEAGLYKVLSPSELATLEVRPCLCWPGSYDPCGIYFEQ